FRQTTAERISCPIARRDRVFSTRPRSKQTWPDRPQDNLVACPILDGVGSEPAEIIQRVDHVFAGRARGWTALGDYQGVELVDIFYSSFALSEIAIVFPTVLDHAAGNRGFDLSVISIRVAN